MDNEIVVKTLDGYSFSSNDVYWKVLQLRNEFYENYHVKPSYVILSAEMYTALKATGSTWTPSGASYDVYIDMEMIPSIRVKTLEDIQIY